MRRLSLVVQNLLFWVLFALASCVSVPCLAVFVVLVGALTWRHRLIMCRIRRAISWYGALILRCGRPFVRVEYRDLAPTGSDGPFIFVVNHRSAADPFLMASLPYECIQVVNIWPFHLPFFGAMAKLGGYLSVREMPVEEFYRRAELLWRQGVCIIAFPEGTRSGSRRMGPFHSSVFRLAQQVRATLVPVAVSGSEQVPPRGSLLLHPATIRVHKLPCLRWEDYQQMSTFQLKSEVHERLRRHLASIESDAT